MKKVTLVLFFSMIVLAAKLSAQWEKVATYDVGAGHIVTHGSTVFLYGTGSSGNQQVLRSTDNGTSWTNIADKFPGLLITMHGHGSNIFAIGVGYFNYSTDDGVTWGSKSATGIPTDVAFIDLISDGTVLYALSNRSIVIKSTDDGSTWTKITVTYPQANLIGLDFAADGSKMVFCATNLGAFVSTDDGASWTLKNPQFAIGSVLSFNNEFFGSTLGMYKLTSDTVWTPVHTGLPSGIGISAGTKGSTALGNKLFTYYYDVISGAKVFTSEDNGNNWSEVGNNLPSATSYSINKILAVTSQYLYCYLYPIFSPGDIGVYRYPIQPSAIIENGYNNTPHEFSLDQNYPNPFNPSTTIKWQLAAGSFVTLKVYDVIGNEVATLINNELDAGSHSVNFDASHLSSGIYFYTLKAGSFIQTNKMLLLK